MQEGFGDQVTRIFLNINKGVLVQRKGNNETVERPSITGTITNIFIKQDGKYGAEMHISIRVSGDIYCIQMRIDSGYARSFMAQAPNIDFAKLIMIRPTFKQEETHAILGMSLMQDDQYLKWCYTNKNPQGMPEAVTCKVKNKTGQLVDGKDYTARIAFLINVLETVVIPKLKKVSAVTYAAAPNLVPDPVDDLPF